MGLKVTKKKSTPGAIRRRKAQQRIRKQAKRKESKKKPSWKSTLKKSYTNDVLKKGKHMNGGDIGGKMNEKKRNKDNKDPLADEGLEGAKETEQELQEEIDVEKMKKLNERDPLGTQLFLKNMPIDATEEELIEILSAYGKIRRVLLVRNRITKVPTGTGFVHCGTSEVADEIYAAAQMNAREVSTMNRSEMKGKTEGLTKHRAKKLEFKLKKDVVAARDPFITIRDIRVTVHRVLSRTDSQETTAAAQRKKKTIKVAGDDPRNLYLLLEGHITPDSPAARDLPHQYIEAIQRDFEARKDQLKNTNFFVSKTRLNVRNIPKTMEEKELRILFNKHARNHLRKHKEDFDKEKWGKYGPIKNIKLLTDANGGSRGYAFVEFVNHNVALNVLRRLNNNPKIFGLSKRLRVAFAIENMLAVQKLQQIKERKRTRMEKDGGNDGEGDE